VINLILGAFLFSLLGMILVPCPSILLARFDPLTGGNCYLQAVIIRSTDVSFALCCIRATIGGGDGVSSSKAQHSLYAELHGHLSLRN
jgi:hypothetical protein